MASSRLGSRGRPPRRGDGSSLPGEKALVPTSAPLPPTALRQLTSPSKAQTRAARSPQLGHVSHPTRSDTGRPQPPTGRGLVTLRRRWTRPTARVVEHLQRVREADAAVGVVRGG
jgi:hypothetical protein